MNAQHLSQIIMGSFTGMFMSAALPAILLLLLACAAPSPRLKMLRWLRLKPSQTRLRSPHSKAPVLAMTGCSRWFTGFIRHNGRDPQAVLDASLVQQPRRDMVKESLLRSLLIANRLGLLTPANLDGMKRGKSTVVTFGHYAGEIAEADHILPVANFPPYGKEFWNLELMPQTLNRRKSDKVGQRQLDLLRRVGQ